MILYNDLIISLCRLIQSVIQLLITPFTACRAHCNYVDHLGAAETPSMFGSYSEPFDLCDVIIINADICHNYAWTGPKGIINSD